MKRELRAYIEAELRDYHHNKAELDEIRDDMLNESAGPPDGLPRGTATSNPTQTRAFKLMTSRRMRYMTGIVQGIGRVLSELEEDKMRLVELKYWQRPRQLTDAGIATKLHIDKRTVYRWTHGICLAIAIELGLVDEIDCHNDVTFDG